MRVINHLGLRSGWLIPTHQNSKLLLMSRYTTVIHIVFLKCTDTFHVPFYTTLILNFVSNQMESRLFWHITIGSDLLRNSNGLMGCYTGKVMCM